MTQPLRIDFISDVVCPWCVIGLKALEQALARTTDVAAPDWHFHAFELNPGMAAEGENAAEHIQRKYGRSPEEGAATRNHIRDTAASLGFTFKGGPETRIWNTFDCHRLLFWAGRAGRQHELKTALFEAHFSRGEPLNDAEVLVAAAVAAGLDGEVARDVLASGRYAEDVRAEEAWCRQEGITAVPAIIFQGKYAVMGGQPVEVFEKVIRRVMAEAA